MAAPNTRMMTYLTTGFRKERLEPERSRDRSRSLDKRDTIGYEREPRPRDELDVIISKMQAPNMSDDEKLSDRRSRQHRRRRDSERDAGFEFDSPPDDELIKSIHGEMQPASYEKASSRKEAAGKKLRDDSKPVREEVTPAKDNRTQGIPSGARWTKIHRRLVNPAALEAGKERFEERSDHIIVLRVLSMKEIENYAIATEEIRGKPHHLLEFSVEIEALLHY
ncbi:uncharacterized protein N7483_005784 [Penicillium malachiteum]|uniref:uncharacterized protein n=1 Tax=Penicillium malachiteum TaxID=1324776 RepID=UPI0025494B75|nr:uncharacterized protein N7483_005784 [Penicillium malachiteum]KAJ5731276.1 hypothetical protein N7483_005784 [Penicillium malachiteum]